MKKILNRNFIGLFLMALTFASCVQDDDYNTPEINFEEPDVTVNSSIQAVKDIYTASGSATPVLIEDDLYLEGYVISDDETGNFYKELIIQDSPENPTAGISIMTDATDLYTFFEPGRKVYVELQGLYVGNDAGVIKIGGLYGGEVGRLNNLEFEQHVLRSGETAEIVPTVITLDELTDSKLNTLVAFENMQFPSGLVGESYGNLGDTFTVNRTVESCETGGTIILRNSGFATFKNELLPAGQGTLTAVLSKFNADYQLYIRDTDDINFEGPRCDPEIVCEGPSGGSYVVFSEDFESYSNFSAVENAGWINTNTSGGNTKFVLGNFDDNKYAQISGFDSGESEIVTYLVSPEINLDESTDEALTFDLEVAYANAKILTVLITENYSGDPATTTWTELPVAIPNEPAEGFGGFESVDNINISCFEGTVRVAFLYEGSDPSATTRYHIDNFEVNGIQ